MTKETKDKMLNIRLTQELLGDIDGVRKELRDTYGQLPSRAFVIRMALTTGLKEIVRDM